MVKLERAEGALLGLAVGDAVGTTLEFAAPGTFEPITDMVGGGPFGLAPGQWTDDTAMALCLAESLAECRGVDFADQMRRYVRWYRAGHFSSTGAMFDIGSTTRRALQEFERTGRVFAGENDEWSAGNGSVMRLAPLAIWAAARPEVDGVALCGTASRTTHGARVAVDACRLLGAIVIGALRGVSKEELLSPGYAPEREYWRLQPLCVEVRAISQGSYRVKEPPRIKGSGYAADCVEAALWAFHRSTNFRDGCLMAANLGDDADTTAAVYGQIAGAYYGVNGIPAEWVMRVAMGEMIRGMGRGLVGGG